MTSFNYNDYYKYKQFSNSYLTHGSQYGSGYTTTGTGVGSLLNANSSAINQYITNSATVYVDHVPTAETMTYYPIVANTTGYIPVYIDNLAKPMSMKYTTSTAEWDMSLNLHSIDFTDTAVKNIMDPTADADCANKRYVDSHSGNGWWTYPALGNVDVNSKVLNNALITFNDTCATPVLTADGVLVLNGNNTSHGRWSYRMTSDIDRFEIFNMAGNGQFTLIVRGDSTQDRTINFCGDGTNFIYTSWRGPIRIGRHTYTTFHINNAPPDILVEMTSYN